MWHFHSFSSFAPNSGAYTLKLCKFFLPSKSQDIQKKLLRFHNIQFFCLPERQISKGQPALGLAAQVRDRQAAAGEHPPHLVVLPLLHLNDGAAGAERRELRGQAVQAVGEDEAGLKGADIRGACRAFMLGIVA